MCAPGKNERNLTPQGKKWSIRCVKEIKRSILCRRESECIRGKKKVMRRHRGKKVPLIWPRVKKASRYGDLFFPVSLSLSEDERQTGIQRRGVKVEFLRLWWKWVCDFFASSHGKERDEYGCLHGSKCDFFAFFHTKERDEWGYREMLRFR